MAQYRTTNGKAYNAALWARGYQTSWPQPMRWPMKTANWCGAPTTPPGARSNPCRARLSPDANNPTPPGQFWHTRTQPGRSDAIPEWVSDNTGNVQAWKQVQAEQTPSQQAANDGNIWGEPTDQAIRFQGQYFDHETGPHYNRFRYYDPDVGRFIHQDPIGYWGGQNLYLYAPNPNIWLDLFGLKTWSYNNIPSRDGFQVHHITPQTSYDKHQDLIKKAGIGKHYLRNLMYLPKCRNSHPIRTAHYCPHPGYRNSISAKLIAIELAGKSAGWTDAQYKDAVERLVTAERKYLHSGKTYFNKNSSSPTCPS